jgi:hypothetical protein
MRGEKPEIHTSGAKALRRFCWFYAGVETPASLRIEFFRSLYSTSFIAVLDARDSVEVKISTYQPEPSPERVIPQKS